MPPVDQDDKQEIGTVYQNQHHKQLSRCEKQIGVCRVSSQQVKRICWREEVPMHEQLHDLIVKKGPGEIDSKHFEESRRSSSRLSAHHREYIRDGDNTYD